MVVGVQCIESGRILKNSPVNPDSFEMILEVPKIARTAKPGQFVMVSCAKTGRSPLLRRPLSIHDVNRESITLLYRVVGHGTEVLADMTVGGFVSVLGPLGHGFEITNSSHHCLVGGGIGIAPLLLLAREIGRVHPQAEITVLAGARNSQELLALEKFQEKCNVVISTDDGSEGHHGFVTELLGAMKATDLSVYTCGPTPMMKGVAVIAKEKGWDCQVSLESHMACGVGACLGCAVDRSSILESPDYVHVCKDGPVFKAEEIWA